MRMRCRLEAKAVATTRPLAPANTSSSPVMTSISDPENPGRSMLVLSPKKARTPSRPSSANRWTSSACPSIGVWSSLKSPLCTMTPAGVCKATATQSGML